MELTINENKHIYLEASSQFYGQKKVYIQYRPMVQVDDEWQIDESIPNSVVTELATGSEYDAYILLTEEQRIDFITSFLGND